MKVYTKTGDKGTTALFGGSRVKKHNARIEAYGTVDELNSYVGLIRSYPIDEKAILLLKEIQNELFVVGAILASDPSKKNLKPPTLDPSSITAMEEAMDEMHEVLPEMKFFVLPGGSQIVSHCHVARCVCRRAERRITELAEDEEIDALVIQYVNRLSDYLFVLSRKVTMDDGTEETPWITR